MEVVCTEASPAGMQTTGKRIMAGTWFDEISRAKPGGTGKQPQKGISPNHVQAISLFYSLYIFLKRS